MRRPCGGRDRLEDYAGRFEQRHSARPCSGQRDARSHRYAELARAVEACVSGHVYLGRHAPSIQADDDGLGSRSAEWRPPKLDAVATKWGSFDRDSFGARPIGSSIGYFMGPSLAKLWGTAHPPPGGAAFSFQLARCARILRRLRFSRSRTVQ